MKLAKSGWIAFLLAVSLPAADFWQSKPFDQWTGKEVQKLLAASPWVRQATVLNGAFVAASGSSDRKAATAAYNPTWMSLPDAQDSAGRPRGGPAGDTDRPSAAPVKLTIQWRSALPIKQALVRAKFGAEAATSPEARQFLDAEEPNYVIAVLGIPRAMLPGAGETAKQALLDGTWLSLNNGSDDGKDPVHPSEIQFRAGAGIDAFFLFPKRARTADDKEIEFSIKLAPLLIKERFRLRDMWFQGKLQL